MHWTWLTRDIAFKTYREATSHEHQVFTTDEAGEVFDIALLPTARAVGASLAHRLRYGLGQLVA